MKKIFNKYIIQKAAPAIAIMLLLSTPSYNQQIKPAKSGYAPANGLKMYYEVYGEGKPLVLLHGSFMTINTNYGQLIPELSKTRKVIAIEFQGHGRTADTDRPFSIENFADDVAGVLKFLKIDSADILGYSLGGMVALNVAIRHPQLVKKLILVSSVFRYEGWSAETRAIFPMIKPEFFERTPIKTAYDSLAPDPKHWTAFVNKMVKLVTTPYDFTEKVKALKNPMFFILGDSDGILPEHAAEMFRIAGGVQNGDMAGLPNSRLAILPATSHTGIFMHSDWLLSMIADFLKAPVK
jgi:pimeloyl-ACP methyl ester carboxylesterase